MPDATSGLILAQAMPEAMFQQMMPLILIMGVFYVLLIRPQQQKAKEHAAFLKDLKKGQSVITESGLHGRILDLSDTDVTLEIAPNVKVRHARARIAAGTATPSGQAATKAE